MNYLQKSGRKVLWILPLVVIPLALFASIPWLKQQNDTLVLGIAAAASIFVMGYSLMLAARHNRRLDEVEIAGQRFAQAKGMTIGSIAAVLVMLVPPLMNALVDLANNIATGSPDKAVKLGITMGFMLVVLLQTLGMIGANFWWERRLGAQPEQVDG